MRPMHGNAIIVPMVHEPSSRPYQDPESWSELLAPRLAQFAAAARHEHVTRAAQELGVPQSTLSRALVRLEQDLGVGLFARKGRTVALTHAGRTFLAAVERALAEVERAAETVRADADPASGRVVFGFLHTMGSETVPALIRAFRADHPRVRFQLVQNYGEAMLEGLRAGTLDLCLTSPVPDSPDLVGHRLDEQRLRLVVPDDHPLAARRRVRLAEAAEEAFVTLEPGYGLRRITDDLCAEAGLPAARRLRGRGGRDAARSRRRGARRRPAPATGRAAPGSCRTDRHGAARRTGDRHRLARRLRGHPAGGRLQAVPALPARPTAPGLSLGEGPRRGNPDRP